MHQIIVQNLGKHFGRRVVFRRLSFSVSAGEVLAVTGANGSGKSTLLRMLAGVLGPSKGSIRLERDGEAVPDEQRPLATGLVAPYLNVYDGLTARENLQFIARARHARGWTERIEQTLDFVGLSCRADERVATYSSGMKQRIKFAAALLTRPPLLLLDEPSSNLDPAGIAMVERAIVRQRTEGGLLVLATNDREEAEKCDRVIRIEDFAV
ncbi:MAG TPA: heme ABC exporter ATP-binding protein CcmA [Rhodothermales bacterium]|nr:heme ABC exporter ATP-binding protein CcmA [Rhodothermales bacterium]